MRAIVLITLVLMYSCLSIEAFKTEKSKNTKEIYHKKHMDKIEEKLAKLEQERLDELENNDDEFDDDDDDEEYDDQEDDMNDDFYDPCENKFCGAGKECVVSEDGEGVCQCIESCDVPVEDRRRVCSNHNETWPSDCELYRQRCLCVEEKPGCSNPENKHLHIDYYGHCQEIEECKKGEIEDFPRRMTEWLFSIMRDLADRQILSPHYTKLEKEAEKDETKKWTYSVLWKWCELDEKPRDKAISRHELFPLRAPLYTLEHCIAPFLDSCDPNNDHFITLKEWATCLKLDAENLEDLEDLCEEIRD